MSVGLLSIGHRFSRRSIRLTCVTCPFLNLSLLGLVLTWTCPYSSIRGTCVTCPYLDLSLLFHPAHILDLSLLVHPSWAEAPKGKMIYVFTHGEISPLLLLLLLRIPPSLETQISNLRPITPPRGPGYILQAINSSLKAQNASPNTQIPDIRPESQPQSLNLSPKTQIPITTRRRWRRNFLMRQSIGHRPLRTMFWERTTSGQEKFSGTLDL